jgi:malate dehydrogenase (oxaloacetate-decarboxylating)
VSVGGQRMVRDITVAARDEAHGQEIVARLERLDGVRVVNVSHRTFLVHLGGKIEVQGRASVKTRDDLSMVYTPGVARVCMAIHADPAKQWALTVKRHMIAVVTDGSAVLGLGNIGPAAAQPVMEGKCMIFRGALDVQARDIDERMKLAAAEAIATLVSDDELNEEYIVPTMFDRRVAEAAREAAWAGGVARKGPPQT